LKQQSSADGEAEEADRRRADDGLAADELDLREAV
jgi:hypothetical protein